MHLLSSIRHLPIGGIAAEDFPVAETSCKSFLDRRDWDGIGRREVIIAPRQQLTPSSFCRVAETKFGADAWKHDATVGQIAKDMVLHRPLIARETDVGGNITKAEVEIVSQDEDWGTQSMVSPAHPDPRYRVSIHRRMSSCRSLDRPDQSRVYPALQVGLGVRDECLWQHALACGLIGA